MESITHAPGNAASARKPNRISSSSSEQESDLIRGFHYDPRRAALGHEYLRRKWLPREGPLFYAFIQVMRSHCYYNAQTGEIRESCYPKVETIARECGVNPATIHRLIQRDKTTGEFVSKNAEALKRFMKVQPRWLYDPKVGHKTQRSSVYLVALDDPPVPEDEHLVEEKAGELAAILTMEQVRQQRQADSTPDIDREHTDLQIASQLTLANCESVMSRKMQDKTLPLTLTSKNNLERTLGGRSSVDWSIGKQQDEEKALGGGEPAGPAFGEPINAPTESAPLKPRLTSSKEVKAHQTQALAEASSLVGETVRLALLALGGSNPAKGVHSILTALVEVAAPLERMPDLFALGQRRLAQQQEIRTIPNATGYLIGIMRNVVVEGMLKGWDVAHMRAEDEEKHVQALRVGQRGVERVLNSESEPSPTGEESPSPVAEPPQAPTLAYSLPDRVEVADMATAATWQDALPDAEQGGQLRRVSMLWGFVRDALSDHLSIARRGQLEALAPKWDAARPRTLLLLCNTTYGARAVELNLRREIEPHFGKLLYASLTSSRWSTPLGRRNKYERPV